VEKDTVFRGHFYFFVIYQESKGEVVHLVAMVTPVFSSCRTPKFVSL